MWGWQLGHFELLALKKHFFDIYNIDIITLVFKFMQRLRRVLWLCVFVYTSVSCHCTRPGTKNLMMQFMKIIKEFETVFLMKQCELKLMICARWEDSRSLSNRISLPNVGCMKARIYDSIITWLYFYFRNSECYSDLICSTTKISKINQFIFN